MEDHKRGRSPSTGQANNYLSHSSASPHPPLDASRAAAHTNLDSDPNQFNLGAQSSAGAYNDPSFTQDYQQQVQWSLDPSFTGFHEQQPGQHHHPILPSQDTAIVNQAFLNSLEEYAQGSQDSNHVSHSVLSQGTSASAATNTDTSAFPSFDFNETTFDPSLDPALFDHIEPSSIDLLPTQQSIEPIGGSLDPMATMQSHSPTPPHLLPDMVRRQSKSPSPHTPPAGYHQSGFQTFNRPRNTSESLDPSSAMFPQGQNEWSGMGGYRVHKRTASDQYSDVSSNQASPYMGNLDHFDANAHSSPLLHPSQDPSYNNDLGLQGFSLNENQVQLQQQQQQQPYHSPGHSPHVSPRLMAQQQLPHFTAADHYGLSAPLNGPFGQQQNGLEMFPAASQEAFPAMNHPSPNDFGQADQMSPPEINIEYAPQTKPLDPLRPGQEVDALSPPLRSQSRNRMRAKSDPYAGSRPSSPGFTGRGRSPSLQPQGSTGSDTLSPFDHPPTSRSPSPARGRNGSVGSRARSTSNASDHRDYILDLANPERTPSNGADSKRVQKHPATFQCSLCPKRFTRAYNLRSHLRTHTDERPFVCTVCGKAFARQHDRKRHEGLHSGEKRFVCKGNLQSNAQWGCGRRFARADALGRHFRSEAGRVCIKPLLDEEAAERQRAWMEQQQHAQLAAGLVAPPPMLSQPQMDVAGHFLPAALLQQYPALAGIDWNALPQGPPPEEEYSGRSSFEASSGGEYYDDMSESEMGSYPDASSMMNSMGSMGQMGMGQHMGMGPAPADAHQQYVGHDVYGHQAGDYLSDFEGR